MRLHSRLCFFMAILLYPQAALPQAPRGHTKAMVDGSRITVDYGRPSLDGRDMVEEQAPPGTVWRMGADEATVLHSEADLIFGDSTVPAGAYSLYARRVDDENWELIFNLQTEQWGTNREPRLDYGAVPLAWEESYLDEEQFTIEIEATEEGGEIRLKWGLHVLKASFSVERRTQ